MKTVNIILLLLIWPFMIMGQTRTFSSQDNRMKVYEGDTVAIQADSAYVIGQAQAFLINERLVALQQAQQRNLELNESHAAVMAKVAEIEEQLKRLIAQLLLDNRLVSRQLHLLMADLDKSIAIIRQSNHDLQKNNDQLKEKLAHLSLTVKHLRKENRRMSRKNRMEKIVIAVASMALGFVGGSVR